MRNSSMYRANISGEKIAYLSEIKSQKEFNQEDNAPQAYKGQGKLLKLTQKKKNLREFTF